MQIDSTIIASLITAVAVIVAAYITRDDPDPETGTGTGTGVGDTQRTLPTFGGRSEFKYTGTIKQGTKIIYGNDNNKNVSAKQYRELIENFTGKVVTVGSDRTNPSPDTLERWLQDNVTPTSISSYVAAILEAEKCAKRVNGNQLKFPPLPQVATNTQA